MGILNYRPTNLSFHEFNFVSILASFTSLGCLVPIVFDEKTIGTIKNNPKTIRQKQTERKNNPIG